MVKLWTLRSLFRPRQVTAGAGAAFNRNYVFVIYFDQPDNDNNNQCDMPLII